jgi:hypothetical protein
MLRALLLPALATEARRAGVADTQVRGMLDALKRRGVPAADAAAVVEEEVAAVRAGAPKENFGAFVQGRLAAGLRGRALADAIRAEHEQRGRGMGRSDSHQAPARGPDKKPKARHP